MKKLFTLCITVLIIIIAAGRPAAGEGKWEWYNPLPGGQPIQMEKIGADTALALCPFGMLVSTDQGETWQYKPSLQDYNFVNMSISETGTIWACTRSALLKSTNFGDSWETVRDGLILINYIYFINDKKGFIFNGDVVHCTVDGGQNWDKSSFPAFYEIKSVFFINDSTGWGCGYNGCFFKTTNGGKSWDSRWLLYDGDMKGIHFIDENKGYIFGKNNAYPENGKYIWSTNNSGKDWSRCFKNQTSDLNFENWDFFEDKGVLTGLDNKLMLFNYTSFNRWDSISYDHDERITNIIMFNTDVFIGWDARGQIIKSTDQGKTWNIKSQSMTLDGFIKVYFRNENKGWLLKWSNFYSTNDGGKSWTKNSIDPNYIYRDIVFIDDNTGFLIASGHSNYYLYRTKDGGMNWEDITNGSYQYNSLAASPEGKVFALVYDSKLLKSEDKGDSWDEIDVDSVNYSNKIYVVNEDTYIVLGNSYPSRLLNITRNGGQTWNYILSNKNSFYIKAVCFIDENIGFLGGSDGCIYKTINGGYDWEEKNDGYAYCNILDIDFSDESNGWAVGAMSAIFETTDGGETWDKKEGSIDGRYNSIYMLGLKSGWIVGDNGTILKYTGDGSPVAETYVSNEEISVMNYPNPFRDMTTLRFNLKSAAHVSTKIYDLSGQVVADLGSKYINPGDYEMQWQPGGLPSGVYFLRISNGKTTAERKLILER